VEAIKSNDCFEEQLIFLLKITFFRLMVMCGTKSLLIYIIFLHISERASKNDASKINALKIDHVSGGL